jgi:hypothetical protein
MAALEDSIAKFENLAHVSHENTDELGIKGSDCKALGDGASRLARSLGVRGAQLNIDAAAAWKIYQDKSTEYDDYHGKEGNLISRVREKEEELDARFTLTMFCSFQTLLNANPLRSLSALVLPTSSTAMLAIIFEEMWELREDVWTKIGGSRIPRKKTAKPTTSLQSRAGTPALRRSACSKS